MKCKPHYHFIDLPNGRRVRTNKDCNPPDDEELGSLLGTLGSIAGGAIGSVIAPGAGTAVGGMLGGALGGAADKATKKKKKKKGGGAAQVSPEQLQQMQAQGVDLSAVKKAISKEVEETEDDIKDMLKSIPNDVKLKVLAALKKENLQAIAKKEKSTKDIDKIVSSVTKAYAPQMTAILKLLQLNKLQSQATQEHKAIVKKQDGEKIQHAILNKVAGVDKKVTSLESSLKNSNANLARARSAATLFGVPTRLL